mgnify:FL=1
MSATGLEEMTPSQPSVRPSLEMLSFPSGRGGGEGSHSRLLASGFGHPGYAWCGSCQGSGDFGFGPHRKKL